MRVLHLSHSFPRHERDALAPYLVDLGRSLDEAGVEVAAVAPHATGLARRERFAGIEVARFRYAPQRLEWLAYRGALVPTVRDRPHRLALLPGYFVAFVVTAIGECRRHRPDVIHAHWWMPAGVVAAVVSRLLGIPFIVHSHGTDVVAATKPGLRQLSGWVLRRAAAVAVVSEVLGRQLEELHPWLAGRIELLRMPVPALAGDRPPPPPLPPSPPLRVVAVGRLSPEKGFDVLVDAVAEVRAQGIDVEADIVGEGPEREPLAARITAHGLGGAVRLVGPLPHDRLGEVFATAHAAVAPSRREGLGLAAIDALAAGRPVIASRVGGLPEAVEDGVDGVLVEAGDPAALANALRHLPLPPPEGNGLEAHHPKRVTEAHLAVYRRVAAAST